MRRAWVIALALGGLISCISPTNTFACPPSTFDAVIHGRVVTPSPGKAGRFLSLRGSGRRSRIKRPPTGSRASTERLPARQNGPDSL